jgi:hypothetical protein
LTTSFGPPVVDAIIEEGMNVQSIAQCIGDSNPYVSEDQNIVPITVDFSASTIAIPTATNVGQQSSTDGRADSLWIFFLLNYFFGINI